MHPKNYCKRKRKVLYYDGAQKTFVGWPEVISRHKFCAIAQIWKLAA